jgi:hypothetical protein
MRHRKATAVHILFLDESGKPSDKTCAVGSGAVAADVYPRGLEQFVWLVRDLVGGRPIE